MGARKPSPCSCCSLTAPAATPLPCPAAVAGAPPWPLHLGPQPQAPTVCADAGAAEYTRGARGGAGGGEAAGTVFRHWDQGALLAVGAGQGGRHSRARRPCPCCSHTSGPWMRRCRPERWACWLAATTPCAALSPPTASTTTPSLYSRRWGRPGSAPRAAAGPHPPEAGACQRRPTPRRGPQRS